MEGYLGEAYLWVKAVHIIIVIFWMAGLFMLPRFFAYHMECDVGSAEDKAWIERETRLMRIILNPAISITWILGIMLILNIGFSAGTWLYAKLILVLILTGFHEMLAKRVKDFAAGKHKKSEKFYRRINEIPALFIILIVLLVVVKPF